MHKTKRSDISTLKRGGGGVTVRMGKLSTEDKTINDSTVEMFNIFQ